MFLYDEIQQGRVFQCSPMPGLNMPIFVRAHHSFVNGIHIGEFVNALEEYLGSFLRKN